MSLFYYFFKTLVGKEVVVELKNDLAIRGTLHSVDQVRESRSRKQQQQQQQQEGGCSLIDRSFAAICHFLLVYSAHDADVFDP